MGPKRRASYRGAVAAVAATARERAKATMAPIITSEREIYKLTYHADNTSFELCLMSGPTAADRDFVHAETRTWGYCCRYPYRAYKFLAVLSTVNHVVFGNTLEINRVPVYLVVASAPKHLQNEGVVRRWHSRHLAEVLELFLL